VWEQRPEMHGPAMSRTGSEPERLSVVGNRERKGSAVAFDSVIGGARDALTVKRVFGDPYEKNGLTVIPAARIMGGGGGGSGEGPQDTGHGEGAGFGMAARPAGVYVIKGDSVRWQPAVDVNSVILGCQVVAILALLTARTAIRTRGKIGPRRRGKQR
jgi:uncharacterized spore protein YtfJ